MHCIAEHYLTVPVFFRPLLPNLTPVLTSSPLPVIPVKIKDKIPKGEYMDFTSLLSKAMFVTNNFLSQQLVALLIATHLPSNQWLLLAILLQK